MAGISFGCCDCNTVAVPVPGLPGPQGIPGEPGAPGEGADLAWGDGLVVDTGTDPDTVSIDPDLLAAIAAAQTAITALQATTAGLQTDVTALTALVGALQAELVNQRLALARDPSLIWNGIINRDANGAAISAGVTWPDGTAGVYTGTPSTLWPSAIDSWSITHGGQTYTQPPLTRDANGDVSVQPAIVLT